MTWGRIYFEKASLNQRPMDLICNTEYPSCAQAVALPILKLWSWYLEVERPKWTSTFLRFCPTVCLDTAPLVSINSGVFGSVVGLRARYTSILLTGHESKSSVWYRMRSGKVTGACLKVRKRIRYAPLSFSVILCMSSSCKVWLLYLHSVYSDERRQA